METQNRLASSNNPYLLQHAENSVDWYPWGDEAFTAAREHNKPIFLSIGYATCHWCHVMAHESFEDKAVAKLMNNAFINIKVDREERPDVDNTYMQICQMLTGHGGWPLTIIMTPSKKPFYAATYIPKESRPNRPGMMQLVPRIEQLWATDRSKLTDDAQNITTRFQQRLRDATPSPLPDTILDTAVQQLSRNFDTVHGGFGGAPKFPTPHTLLFLLRYAHLRDDANARNMATTTLTHMRRGGLWDHLGGGFHRYSTDAQWKLPHFEKMGYDQAMHLLAYTEAWQQTQNPLFKQTVDDLTDYLFRDLQHAEGAFFSGEDADSEGHEGTFYVWSIDEVRSLLPAADAELAIEVFNLAPEGNYADEATGQRTGTNILHRTASIVELAGERNLSAPELAKKLKRIRQTLFAARTKRDRPFLDDKILTDWNGLLIAALAKAGAATQNQPFVKEAERAAAFIIDNLRTAEGALLHRFRNHDAAINGTLDDYAFFIFGLIELYQATFKQTYLKRAVQLQQLMMDRFWDEDTGGFFFTDAESDPLLGRKKEWQDNALPAGNSIAAMNLLRLGRITANQRWEERAHALMQVPASQIKQMPRSFTCLLQAWMMGTQPSTEIVIAGPRDNEHTLHFTAALHQHYLPRAVFIQHSLGDGMEQMAPYVSHQPMIDGQPTIYVCENYACKEPIHTVAALKEQLTQN